MTIEIQRPTPELRFISRSGKRILQQYWEILEHRDSGLIPRYEWRDIIYQPNAEQGDETVHP